MSTQIRTNKSLTVSRRGVIVFTDAAALCLPARPDILAIYESSPGANLYEIIFDDLYDVRDQDQLVDEVDTAKTYRVVSVAQFETPRLAHTECAAEAIWGTE